MPRPSRWKRRFIGSGLIAAVFTSLIWLATRTGTPPVPEGVTKLTLPVTLVGAASTVDIYLPAGVKEAPLVIIAHGFSRSRLNMTGWGGRLAQEGFIAAVLDQPWWLAHVRNSRAINEVGDLIRSGSLNLAVKPTAKTVLIGMSMGGLTTLLATQKHPVDAWIGLDPVDISGGGVIAAAKLKCPCAILSAEPATFNWDGNPRKIQASMHGTDVFSLQIKGSTHCDSEWPTDTLAQIACGRTDESRRQIYEHYLVAFLRARILNDPAADKTLAAASTDTRVRDLSSNAQVP